GAYATLRLGERRELSGLLTFLPIKTLAICCTHVRCFFRLKGALDLFVNVLFVEFTIGSGVLQPGESINRDVVLLARQGDELAAHRDLGVKEVLPQASSERNGREEPFGGSDSGGFHRPPEGKTGLYRHTKQVVGLIAVRGFIAVPPGVGAFSAGGSKRRVK